MFAQCADALAKKMIAGGIIEEEKASLYVFGIEQGLRSLWELVLVLVTGLFMNRLWQCAVILLAFIPIRIYAGGYHAKTPMRCIIESWVLMFGALLWLCYMPEFIWLHAFIFILLGVWLWFLCPVQDIHKKLYQYEIKKYRKKALIFFVVWSCVYILGKLCGADGMSRCIMISFSLIVIVVTVGRVKNIRIEKNEKKTAQKMDV